MKRWCLLCGLMLVMMLTACSSVVTPSNEYLLMDTEGYQDKSAQTTKQSIQLMPIIVANYLGGNEIVLVSQQGEVFRSQSNLWAEPLSAQLMRLTQQHLEVLLPDVIWFSRQRLPARPVVQLSIEVDTFYADLNGMVHIAGRWHLFSPSGETLFVRSFQVSDDLPSDGYPTLVKTLSTNWFEKVVDPMSATLVQLLR